MCEITEKCELTNTKIWIHNGTQKTVITYNNGTHNWHSVLHRFHCKWQISTLKSTGNSSWYHFWSRCAHMSRFKIGLLFMLLLFLQNYFVPKRARAQPTKLPGGGADFNGGKEEQWHGSKISHKSDEWCFLWIFRKLLFHTDSKVL